MKPAILVLSHPNNNEKERIVKDFGNFIKQFNLPTYLFTNYPTSKSSELEYDGSFFHNYNPEVFSGANWHIWNMVPGTNLKHYVYLRNWGYSGTHCAHLGYKFLKMMGYTHVLFFGYDSEMDYDKIRKFIDFSLTSFDSGKKGIFQEYPSLNNYEGVCTTTFACEVDFFIDVFGEMLELYGPEHPIRSENPSYLLEHLFKYTLKPYTNNINIVPLKEAIKDTYRRSDNPLLPDGSNYYIGYFQPSDKVLIATTSTLYNNFQITDESNKILDLELISNNEESKVLQFSPKPNSFFNVKLENQLIDTILYNEGWKSSTHFEKQ